MEQERKLAALANFDRSVEEIREITGPAGPLFPLAPNPMAASTVRSLKRRYSEYDDVLHRKQRVDGGTLRTAELQLLYSTFAWPGARAKSTTPVASCRGAPISPASRPAVSAAALLPNRAWSRAAVS